MQVEEPKIVSSPDVQACGTADTSSNEEARRYLDFIFDGITQGFVEVRYLSPGRKLKIVNKPVFIPLPLDQSQVSDGVLASSQGHMIAVGIAPRYKLPQAGKTGKDYDVLQVGCVWADLNYSSYDGGVIGVSRLIREFPLRPSIIVNSGYGRQVYFVLNSTLSDWRLLEWDDLIQSLREALNGSNAISIS